ncbi:hypothetical protein DP124_12855 [Clostridium tetani]|uniref:hypothetical protein n=1 Tax=Clostridium tetani TaxID=1513 RepID=UPI00100AE3F9|nr:hypothetical protein [Clostridium tetani]RXI49607.1 hypothetical protein DP124_12855 [Clostridium tetani]
MNKKIVYIGLVSIGITLISIGLFLNISTKSIKKPQPKKHNYISGSIQHKNKTEKIDKNKNKVTGKEELNRIENLNKYTNKKKTIVTPKDLETEQKPYSNFDISISNLNNLFQKSYLNLDQFIDLETKLNLGINEINKIKHIPNLKHYFSNNKENLKNVYGIKTFKDLESLVNIFKNSVEIKEAFIEENSIKKTSNKLNFNIKLKDNNIKITQVNVTTTLNKEDIILYWNL